MLQPTAMHFSSSSFVFDYKKFIILTECSYVWIDAGTAYHFFAQVFQWCFGEEFLINYSQIENLPTRR